MVVTEWIFTVLEDTCVLVAGAYVLTRGSALAILLDARRKPAQTWVLGLYFAGLATVQDLLPESQHPFAPSTLVVTFAASIAGPMVGIITAAGAIATALLLHELPVALATPPALIASILSGTLLGKRLGMRGGFQTGVVAQSMAVVANALAYRSLDQAFDFPTAAVTVIANGFGVLLMTMVVRDAALRNEANRLALENEANRARGVRFELDALRSRINPHFLNNTLTTIAALCTVDAYKARTATVRLGELMRRALEIDLNKEVPLWSEIANCRGYLEIEELRLGHRLQSRWEIEHNLDGAFVPALSLTTLVENAVLHGVAPCRMGYRTVTITLKRSGNHALIAVKDDGVGFPAEARSTLDPDAGSRPHGLAMVNRQLTLRHGRRSRLRVHGAPGQGTLVAFTVPLDSDGGPPR